MPRGDGRGNQDVRGLGCKVDVTRGAQGSSYVERDGCKLTCSVHGPKQLVGGEYDDSCTIRVNWGVASFAEDARRNNKLDHNLSTADTHMSRAIESAFERAIFVTKYPKSLIDISILVLESDTDVFPACIAATSLALAQAGIELRDMVVTTSAVLCNGMLKLGRRRRRRRRKPASTELCSVWSEGDC